MNRIAFSLFVTLVSSTLWGASPSYSVTPLVIDGVGLTLGSVYPASVNDAGEVVGYAYVLGGAYQPFVWRAGGGSLVVPSSSLFSTLNCINKDGRAVGFVTEYEPAHGLPSFTRGLSFENNALSYINLPSSGAVNAIAINDSDRIVGYSSEGAFVADGATVTLLGPDVRPVAVNNTGILVGQVSNVAPDHAVRGFRSDGQTVWALPTLGGSNSSASDVNDTGTIVGVAENVSGVARACLWMDDVPTDLGALSDGADSRAVAINAGGQIIGSARNAEGHLVPVAWEEQLPVDLNSRIDDPSWLLLDVSDINTSGQIVGYGLHNGAHTGFILTPTSHTPEPAGAILCCLPLAWATKRRHRS